MLPNENNNIINNIKKKLDVMTKSKYRTTNFSVIEHFAKYDFQPLNINLLIVSLVVDYKSNPSKYVLSSENGHFKSEKTFENSVKNALNKNKSFVKGPGDGEISLNFPKTLEYLQSMFYKYKSNSRDIKTPIKIPKRKIEEKKKPKVRNIKKEKNEEDSDSENSLRNYKKKKIDNFDFRSPRKDYYQRNINPNKYKEFHLEKEDNGIYNLRDSDSDSVFDMIKKEVKKEKESFIDKENINIPEIFNQNLFKKCLTSSIDKNSIFDSIKQINDELQYIEDHNCFVVDKDKEEKNRKLQEIKNYLKQLLENKVYYETLCEEVKKWQEEIYYVYKAMQSQLNSIKIEIMNKTYSFDIYAKLRDIIFIQENKYNQIVNVIATKLKEIKNVEDSSAEKQICIKRLLERINIKIKIANSIEKAIKLNEIFSFNHITFKEFPRYNNENERNLSKNIEEIIDNFNQEKAKIVDSMTDIDKDIGNISII